jgi:hypothetical protein
VGHNVLYTPSGDFIVDDKYTFEIGGSSKQQRQIKGIDNAYNFVTISHFCAGLQGLRPV